MPPPGRPPAIDDGGILGVSALPGDEPGGPHAPGGHEARSSATEVGRADDRRAAPTLGGPAPLLRPAVIEREVEGAASRRRLPDPTVPGPVAAADPAANPAANPAADPAPLLPAASRSRAKNEQLQDPSDRDASGRVVVPGVAVDPDWRQSEPPARPRAPRPPSPAAIVPARDVRPMPVMSRPEVRPAGPGPSSTEDEPQVIRVSIGRIEVRAPQAAPPPAREPERHCQNTLSLDDYLRGRQDRRGGR